jgi:hypothetical protein
MMPNTLCVNGGALLRTTSGLRFINPPLSGSTYCNAQIDDYQSLPRCRFPNRPPLRLSLCAHFSHPAGELTGTAGFGFWNDPFLMTELRMPALPRALWFFYAAPPSDLRLAVDTPGNGWKAAALDALRLDSLAALPLATLAIPAMRNSQLYRRLWPYFERKFRIAEQLLDTEVLDGDMTAWHEYVLDWRPESATFLVDGRVILAAPAPRGPLGLVIWIDNQYMAVHPRGSLRYGLVAKAETQWMEIDDLHLER